MLQEDFQKAEGYVYIVNWPSRVDDIEESEELCKSLVLTVGMLETPGQDISVY